MAILNVMSNKHVLAAILLLFGLLVPNLEISVAHSIGVCYGRNGNNLPSPQEVMNLFKNNGITRMRIYDPDSATLEALRGTNIELTLGVPNADLKSLATDTSTANQWVQKNVKNYSPEVIFRYIAVGNEVDPNTDTVQYAPYVGPAMENIFNAIKAIGLQNQIKVSTALYLGLLGNSYPPSHGSFRDDVRSFVDPILKFLVNNGMPLLVNVYPYFGYMGNQKDISLSYALFTSPGAVVIDGALKYQNLFAAMIDAYYSALEKAGATNVEIVVSESGWPSQGSNAATIENGEIYYNHLINQVSHIGTPKKPGKPIETYLFAIFDENIKTGAETEHHFGLFSPNKQPKYHLPITGGMGASST